jgi:hypothetical protein
MLTPSPRLPLWLDALDNLYFRLYMRSVRSDGLNLRHSISSEYYLAQHEGAIEVDRCTFGGNQQRLRRAVIVRSSPTRPTFLACLRHEMPVPL